MFNHIDLGLEVLKLRVVVSQELVLHSLLGLLLGDVPLLRVVLKSDLKLSLSSLDVIELSVEQVTGLLEHLNLNAKLLFLDLGSLDLVVELGLFSQVLLELGHGLEVSLDLLEVSIKLSNLLLLLLNNSLHLFLLFGVTTASLILDLGVNRDLQGVVVADLLSLVSLLAESLNLISQVTGLSLSHLDLSIEFVLLLLGLLFEREHLLLDLLHLGADDLKLGIQVMLLILNSELLLPEFLKRSFVLTPHFLVLLLQHVHVDVHVSLIVVDRTDA